ncbi:MAG TPA: glycoside hydrolase family 127 protein [Bacillota bacterium]|nr:glycoside hydrolase family 127 protein [Bacillota bacterium]
MKRSYAKLSPIPKEAVQFNLGFWQDRLAKNRAAMPKLLAALREHGVLDNFKYVKDPRMGRRGLRFTDSDLYKWLEGACYALPDPVLEPLVEEVCSLIAGAQGEDGYLNTYFIHERAHQRFSDLEHGHELYCAGHLIEAAIAHKHATGKEELFQVAVRFADYLVSQFGPGKIEKADGHPEVELALVKLYRETGEEKYLNLARFFLERLDFRNQQEIVGHAVRAAYYASGLADLYLETGDADFLAAAKRFWQNMVEEKIYLTGGLGGRVRSESVGRPFELPLEGAYAETCAAIGNIFWNSRMLAITCQGKYADLLERVLYNGFLAGVSLSGDKYFYENPLAYNGKPYYDPWHEFENRCLYQRKLWHDCTCCPPNVQRFLASLGNYFYSTSPEGLWVHLYDNSELNWQIDGVPVQLVQTGSYPWDGKLSIQLKLPKLHEFSLFLRLPGWAENYTLLVDGEKYEAELRDGYLEIRNNWQDNKVELNLDVPVVLMEANPRAAETRSSTALMRGPVVYCIEQADNPNIPILEAKLDSAGEFVLERI